MLNAGGKNGCLTDITEFPPARDCSHSLKSVDTLAVKWTFAGGENGV